MSRMGRSMETERLVVDLAMGLGVGGMRGLTTNGCIVSFGGG